VLIHPLNNPIFVAGHADLYEVVALWRMEAAGQKGATSIDAHATHYDIVRLGALHELKVSRQNHLGNDSRLGHPLPDLKDTGDIMRLTVYKKGM
jgi:hypothetical protein